jgi:hypothetical protein
VSKSIEDARNPLIPASAAPISLMKHMGHRRRKFLNLSRSITIVEVCVCLWSPIEI